MTVRRVLITGSRDWTNRRTVWLALHVETQDLRSGDALVVVHGECPTGADRLAKRWVEVAQQHEADHHAAQLACHVHEESHPADWESYGKAAGHIRNGWMVDQGADVCLAFPLPQSKGTFDCMRKAKKGGIPVKVFTPFGES